MGTNRETLREETAGEVRALLARRRISASELGRRLGWKQSYMARRIDGRVALDLDDLQAIAAALEVSVLDLLPPSARETATDIPPRTGELTQSYGHEAKPGRSVTADRPIDNRPPGRGPDGGTGPRRTARVARTGRH